MKKLFVCRFRLNGQKAAQRIAMMFSFFSSCAAQNINPSKWLSETLEKINDTKINNLHILIPGNSEV
jgi:transposase